MFSNLLTLLLKIPKTDEKIAVTSTMDFFISKCHKGWVSEPAQKFPD